MRTSTHPRHLIRKVLARSSAAVTIRDGDITIDGEGDDTTDGVIGWTILKKKA